MVVRMDRKLLSHEKHEREYVVKLARKILRDTEDAKVLYGVEAFITMKFKIGQIRRVAKYILGKR